MNRLEYYKNKLQKVIDKVDKQNGEMTLGDCLLIDNYKKLIEKWS